MEIEQRVRGVVLAQVHAFGGNLVRIGEELQTLSRRPQLFAVAPAAPSLTDGSDEAFSAEAASSAEVYAEPPELPTTEPAVAVVQVAEPAEVAAAEENGVLAVESKAEADSPAAEEAAAVDAPAAEGEVEAAAAAAEADRAPAAAGRPSGHAHPKPSGRKAKKSRRK